MSRNKLENFSCAVYDIHVMAERDLNNLEEKEFTKALLLEHLTILKDTSELFLKEWTKQHDPDDFCGCCGLCSTCHTACDDWAPVQG